MMIIVVIYILNIVKIIMMKVPLFVIPHVRLFQEDHINMARKILNALLKNPQQIVIIIIVKKMECINAPLPLIAKD